MKKEKQVRSYKRRTKSGKIITVKAHTAKYDAADEKAKGTSKKEGAGKELEERKKKSTKLEIPLNKEEEKKVLDEVKDEEKKSSSKKSAEKKTTKKVRPVDSGTNGPTPKKKSEAKVAKTTASKPATSEPAFTAAEFKEQYRGTGSAADKKVAKALRAQLGRSGYRKLEDEAIDNYSSRGHLSMFKKVSGGSSSKATPKQPTTKAIDLSKVSVPKGYTLNGKPRKFKDDEGSGHKVAATDKNGNKVTLYRYDDKTASKLGENNKKWSLEFGSEESSKKMKWEDFVARYYVKPEKRKHKAHKSRWHVDNSQEQALYEAALKSRRRKK